MVPGAPVPVQTVSDTATGTATTTSDGCVISQAAGVGAGVGASTAGAADVRPTGTIDTPVPGPDVLTISRRSARISPAFANRSSGFRRIVRSRNATRAGGTSGRIVVMDSGLSVAILKRISL